MGTGRVSGFAIILVLCASVAHAATTERAEVQFPGPEDHVTVHLEHAGPSLLLVPVQINGQDAGLFLLDTGTSSISLDRELASKLKLKKTNDSGMQVMGGKARVDVFAIDSASIGGVRIGQTFVTAQNLGEFRTRLGEKFHGVLGNDFLSRMPFTIDHRQATLTLHDPARFKPPGPASCPMVMLKHDPGIRVRIEDEIDEWFVVDTGMSDAIYFRPHLATLHQAWTLRKPFHPRPMLGFAGLVVNFVAPVERVHVLGRDLPRSEIAYSLGNEGEFPATVGMVGMGVLRDFKLTLDYAGGSVWAEPFGDQAPAEWDAPDFKVNQRDVTGMTPLMRAVEMGRADYAKRFLAASADPNAQDNLGYSALHSAARKPDVALIQLLMSNKATIAAKTTQDETPLMFAAGAGSGEGVQTFLDAKASVQDEDLFGRTALIFAAEQGDLPIVRTLLKAGAKVDAVSRSHGSALFVAVIQGHADIVQALLEAGADPNAKQSSDGSTPLGVAAFRGWEPIVRDLLKHGAKVDGQSRNRQTPLHLAARDGRTEIVRILLEAGASRDVLDYEHKSPFERADQGGHLAAMRLLYVPPTTQP